DILAHRHPRRDVLAVDDLERAGFEQQAQDRLQPRQRPFFGKRGGDHLIEPVAVPRYAAHDLGEQRLVSLAVIVAVYLLPEPVAGEFAHDSLGAETGVQFELIQRLNRRQSRRPPPSAAALTQRAPFTKRRLSATIVRHALTALPPMSRPSGELRASAWASFSQVAMPKPTARPSRQARSCRPRVLSLQTWS